MQQQYARGVYELPCQGDARLVLAIDSNSRVVRWIYSRTDLERDRASATLWELLEQEDPQYLRAI